MEQQETKKDFNPVIFVSDYRGFQPLDETGKPICRFTPFAVNHPEKGQISKGHYICRDEKVYQRLKDFMEHTTEKTMKIVKRLPRATDHTGHIVRGVATSVNPNEVVTLGDDEIELIRELGQLQAKYYKEDSGYKEFKSNIKESSKKKIADRVAYIESQIK